MKEPTFHNPSQTVVAITEHDLNALFNMWLMVEIKYIEAAVRREVRRAAFCLSPLHRYAFRLRAMMDIFRGQGKVTPFLNFIGETLAFFRKKRHI